MKRAFLKRISPELSIIGGIGEFAAHLPALPVPDSIGHQYDTAEMKAAGWIVAWTDADEEDDLDTLIDEQSERSGFNTDLIDK